MTIPSQRRYVGYWQKSLSFPEDCPPHVNLPEPTSKVLQQIRIYDAKNVQTIFFVLSEMQEVCHALSNDLLDNVHQENINKKIVTRREKWVNRRFSFVQ